MASESEPSESFIENLASSRNRNDVSLFLPLILAVTNNRISSTSTSPSDQLSDRIILVNPLTQSMVVIETGSSSTFDSIVSELMMIKEGQPPASKSSIESLPIVEICETDEKGECVVCLDEMGVDDKVVKEMPCKHRFHGDCVGTWLKIHGSCPICRYKMPEEEEEISNKAENGRRRRRREIWMSFSTGSERRNRNNQAVSANSNYENELDHAAPEA